MAVDSPTICRRVVYHGRVQGVGFRWTAMRIARGLDVMGYVRNCSDGTVELLIQGPPGEVSSMLEQLSVVMSGNIEQTDISEETVQSDLSGFSVRR